MLIPIHMAIICPHGFFMLKLSIQSATVQAEHPVLCESYSRLVCILFSNRIPRRENQYLIFEPTGMSFVSIISKTSTCICSRFLLVTTPVALILYAVDEENMCTIQINIMKEQGICY